MGVLLVIVGAGIAFALFQVFVSNPAAQKILPTGESASIGRRIGYSIVHRLVLAAILLAVVGVLALLGA